MPQHGLYEPRVARGLWRGHVRGADRRIGRVRWGGAAALLVFVLLLTSPAGALADDAYSHDSTSPVTRTDWMGRLSDSLQLSELTLPGTHDSGALYGGEVAQAQTMDIQTQLDAGIRAFDIRLGWNGAPCVGPDDLWVVHGISCQQQKFDDVLQTMTTFLKAHRRETIVMAIQDDTGSPVDKQTNTEFDRKIQPEFAPYASYIWSPNCNSSAAPCHGNPDLGQVRGKIVIIQNWWPGAAWTGISGWSTPLWTQLKIQNDWDQPDIFHLAEKWKSVYTALIGANSAAISTPYVNFLSAYPGGSYPYFMASGKSSAGTGDPQLLTPWTRGVIDTCSPNTECLPDYPSVNCTVPPLVTCGIAFKGINQFTEDFIHNSPGSTRLGILLADFPGPGSSTSQGLIGSEIGVDQRYAFAGRGLEANPPAQNHWAFSSPVPLFVTGALPWSQAGQPSLLVVAVKHSDDTTTTTLSSFATDGYAKITVPANRAVGADTVSVCVYFFASCNGAPVTATVNWTQYPAIRSYANATTAGRARVSFSTGSKLWANMNVECAPGSKVFAREAIINLTFASRVDGNIKHVFSTHNQSSNACATTGGDYQLDVRGVGKVAGGSASVPYRLVISVPASGNPTLTLVQLTNPLGTGTDFSEVAGSFTGTTTINHITG